MISPRVELRALNDDEPPEYLRAERASRLKAYIASGDTPDEAAATARAWFWRAAVAILGGGGLLFELRDA